MEQYDDLLALFRVGELELTEPSPEESWLDIAGKIVHGPRQQSYAHPVRNFLRMAIAWSIWLMGRGKLVRGTAIDPDDIVWMMVSMKIMGREINCHQDDNGVDNIGYTYCWQRLDSAMAQLGLGGMAWFRGKTLADLVQLMEDLGSGQR